MSVKIAIIGATGQIARSLASHLPKSGHEIVVLARPELDLLQSESVIAAIRQASPTLIINPAAYTLVDKAETEPELAAAINIDGARAVAQASEAIGARLIHFSTDYVYDGTKTTHYAESDRTVPLGVYGRTKLAGERAIQESCASSVILRTSWVNSAHGSNFVKTMLRLAAERPELKVVADQFGAPSFADDIANAVNAMLPRLIGSSVTPEHFGVFHMTNAGETSWYGFAEAIMAGAAARGVASVPVHAITTADYPTPARRPANSRLSNNKLREVYGISMPHWQEGLERCLDKLLSA